MKTRTQKTKPLRGKPLLKAAWNHIAEHPEEWDQTAPVHEGPCCIGAMARRIGNIPTGGPGAATSGLNACGFKWGEKDFEYLYHSTRTLPQLRARVVKLCGARGVLTVPKQ